MIVLLLVIVCIVLAGVSIVAFSLPWTEDALEAWLDEWKAGRW